MKETKILSVQVGLPKTLNGTTEIKSNEEPWTTGIFKTTLCGPVWLGKLNLAGDAQAGFSAQTTLLEAGAAMGCQGFGYAH